MTHIRKLMRKGTLLPLLLILALLLASCSMKDDGLKAYRESMTETFDALETCTTTLGEIDPAAEDALPRMVEIMKEMTDITAKAAEVSAPEGMENAQYMAGETSHYLALAVENYESAMAGEELSPELIDVGNQYYAIAQTRLGYWITCLHGEIPEELENQTLGE